MSTVPMVFGSLMFVLFQGFFLTKFYESSILVTYVTFMFVEVIILYNFFTISKSHVDSSSLIVPFF